MGVAFTLGFFGIMILIPIALIVIAITGIIFFIAGLVLRKVHKKAEKRKIYPIVFMVAGVVFVLSSSVAFFTPSINPLMIVLTNSEETEEAAESKEEYLPPPEQARQQSVAIIESVQSKDTESLKMMFCEKAKNELDLDSELKTFMEFIDGNIVSYDEPWGNSVGGESVAGVGKVREDWRGKILNIKTDTGKTYEIRFFTHSIDQKQPELVGVISLSIRDCDVYVYDSVNGYPDYGYYTISVGY